MIRVVALGDSTTNCVDKSGVAEQTAWRALVARELPGRTGEAVEVINAGVNADVTALVLGRLNSDVLQRHPDWVIVMLGTNDAGYFRPPDGVADTPRVSLDDFFANMREIVSRVLDAGAALVLCTSVPMSGHYGLADLPQYVANGLNYLVEQYAAAVRQLAEELALPLADIYAAFQSHPQRDDMIPDGIHPNPDGQRLIADTILPVLEEAIRWRREHPQKGARNEQLRTLHESREE